MCIESQRTGATRAPRGRRNQRVEMTRRYSPGLTGLLFRSGSQDEVGRVLPRNLLDAGDQLVDGLVNRHLLVDHAIHCLGPDVLVVENGEFVVLGELKRHGAARILVMYRFAVAVLGPERPCLRRLRHWVPAAERALYIRGE